VPDWDAWHAAYDQDTWLRRRLAVVQQRISRPHAVHPPLERGKRLFRFVGYDVLGGQTRV
jgi:hypothetical protein